MTDKKALSADAILDADDLQLERVNVPEWGGFVLVRGFTGAERDGWETEQYRLQGAGEELASDDPSANAFLQNMRARLVVRCVVDEDGERIFSDSDAEKLGRKAAVAVARVFEVCRKLNGITKEEEEELSGN